MKSPTEVIGERGWDRLIQEKIKELIDDKVHVLRQNFHDDKPELNAYRPEKTGEEEDGDGTQFQSYINFVMVKVQTSDVIKSEK